MSTKCCSRDGEGRKDKEGGGGLRSKTKLCATKLYVKDGVWQRKMVCVWQNCVWKMVCVKVVCKRERVTKLCVKDGVAKMVGDKVVWQSGVWKMVCDNVVCERWCVKDGKVTKMVCERWRVTKMVCQRWCVTKMVCDRWCVKVDGVWQSGVWKMVCERWRVTKMVCKRWCVTKMVCKRWCVTKMVCERWCVKDGGWQSGVWKMACDKDGVSKMVCDKDGVWKRECRLRVCVCNIWIDVKFSPFSFFPPSTLQGDQGRLASPGPTKLQPFVRIWLRDASITYLFLISWTVDFSFC